MAKLKIILSSAVAVAILASCSGTPDSPVAETPRVQTPPAVVPPTPVPIQPPSPVVAPAPVRAPGEAQGETITLEDNNKSILLSVGETFLLKLGESYDWNVSVDDQSVVAMKIGYMVVRGAQGIFEAKKEGATTLTAVGDPPCRKSVPACGAPTILFRLSIDVKKK